GWGQFCRAEQWPRCEWARESRRSGSVRRPLDLSGGPLGWIKYIRWTAVAMPLVVRKCTTVVCRPTVYQLAAPGRALRAWCDWKCFGRLGTYSCLACLSG
ncbi:unnamed protein product, partial [Ectocarpus fasciculatus]